MALSETRIVIFEKIGFESNFHDLMDDIEIHIINSKKGGNPCVFIPIRWIKNELVRKILNENGYIVSLEIGYEARISWN